jgi:hypothetical protein
MRLDTSKSATTNIHKMFLESRYIKISNNQYEIEGVVVKSWKGMCVAPSVGSIDSATYAMELIFLFSYVPYRARQHWTWIDVNLCCTSKFEQIFYQRVYEY